MVTATTQRVLTVVVGQSNELGSGDQKAQISGPYGNPLKDPVLPNAGSLGSRWPILSGLMGQRGRWLYVHNSAVGSTSIVDSWLGGCRAWVSGMAITRGSYIISNGGFWKSNLAAGTVVSSTVAPTGTSNTTGADTIPWLYVGAPAAGDVDGAVYAPGSARFDPNGYCAAAIAGFSPIGFDEKVMFIAFGQGDKSLATSRARFSQALQTMAAYGLANGATKALVGFTCYGTSTGLTDYYDSTLVPGWYDALSAMAGNPRVFKGANIYLEVGALPEVAANVTTPGINNVDKLHLNNEALKLAAARDDIAFAAAGC